MPATYGFKVLVLIKNIDFKVFFCLFRTFNPLEERVLHIASKLKRLRVTPQIFSISTQTVLALCDFKYYHV